jgi:gamma-glutamyltranspeptidase/glutathione hydrolase
MRDRDIRTWVGILSISVALMFGVTAAADVAPSGPPTSIGMGGAAGSVERVATQTAIDTLKGGGNAVDAAVAAAGVLGVTEPFSCGIGGGGFMVIRTANGTVTTIDGRETAPEAMTPTSFWENGAPLPFNDARWSGMSVGVPGTLATWAEALEKYGTMTLAQVLQPGIRVARNGFVVDQTFFDQTQAAVGWFDDIPATAALFLDPDGTPRDVGTIFRNPDLVRAYERIAHLA